MRGRRGDGRGLGCGVALVDLRDLVQRVGARRRALVAVGLTRLDHLATVVAAAEAAAAPLVLAVAEADFPGPDFEPALAAALTAVRRTGVPAVLLVEGVDSAAAATRAINLGATAIGIEPGAAVVPAIAAPARASGIPVAVALGSGAAPGDCPDEADLLVVPAARLPGLAAPARPLLVHAEAERAPSSWTALRAPGVAVIAVRCPSQAGRDTVRERVEQWLRAAGSAGLAAELGGAVRPWQTVEHLIVYNVQGIDAPAAEAMMREGREVLARIPGVRRVASGRALADGARYRFCWVIEFTGPAVIDSYRDHPLHVAFADRLFRPVAGDRLSIDFLLTE